MDNGGNIYMVGIGGIGMSALAQLFVHQKRIVTGSDREESPVTKLLGEKGITVLIGQKKENVPIDAELIVYSDAVPPDNPERQRAKDMGIPQISYYEALGEISKNTRTIAVSGTHGKTTTTGMLAKILHDAGKKPTAIIGSIVRDFGSNFLPGNDDLFVIEACEYKDHILKLSPEILVITNIEWDHTDYFPTFADLQTTFRKAVEKVPPNGCIVADPTNQHVAEVLSHSKAPIIDYTTQTVPRLQVIGDFNIENAQAAKAAARTAFPHLQESYTDRALLDFKGSWRRFEYKGKTRQGALVYDDYAHHPTAIAKTIAAAREEFPGKKIIVAFHPHLYSRTRDLMDDFARSLALADEIVLAPIYAARENPITGVTSDVLANKIKNIGTAAESFSSLPEVFKYLNENLDLQADSLLITMGAGDIYKVAEQII
ncbi:MAG TPA: Mur ligase domain-containing protein [Candidatus Paceibacterota bacterium]